MKTFVTSTVIAVALATGAMAEGETHYVAIHVDENDPQVMNMALNNAANVSSYYESIGDEVIIELVAYGPGLNMFVAGKSPVEDRISAMSLELENMTFSACQNTLDAMTKKTGAEVPLLEEAVLVPSGVVQLITLQEKGYAYVRP